MTLTTDAAMLPEGGEKYRAVYVHIPFCVQKCLYCDFASYACSDESLMRRYARAVEREIACNVALGTWIDEKATIYFGGGTPSLLPIDALAAIAGALKNYGFWRSPAEATIEVNPGTADVEKLSALRQLGFDRVSFGVQSLDDSELRAIGRIHTAQEALAAVDMARQAGFERISADLIYGLPGQTLASLERSLTLLSSSGIEHLSVYGLTLEEGTPLERLVRQGKIALPDEDEAADMYEYVQDFCRRAGFERYEISNYARNGQYSRHNLVYWRYEPYAAFGAAACAFNGSLRRTAACGAARYIAEARQGTFSYGIERLTAEDLLAECMFMGLRTRWGVNLAEVKKRYGVNVLEKFGGRLEKFFGAGCLELTKAGFLRLTERGAEVGNLIFEIFVKD